MTPAGPSQAGAGEGVPDYALREFWEDAESGIKVCAIGDEGEHLIEPGWLAPDAMAVAFRATFVQPPPNVGNFYVNWARKAGGAKHRVRLTVLSRW